MPIKVLCNSHDWLQFQIMWRRVHVLSPMQSLVMASVCAAFISTALTILLVSREQTAFRIIIWPEALDPYITFSVVLIGVISPLLGYYHLGRLGFLLTVASGFAITWLMAVCAVLCFAYVGYNLGHVWLSFGTYSGCIALTYSLLVWLHLWVSNSPTLHAAQQKLRLLSEGRSGC